MDVLDRSLPVGWMSQGTSEDTVYVSVLDELACRFDPRGLPAGWVVRLHKTLGLIYTNADDLLAGTCTWTLTDPRGLIPTNTSLHVDRAGRTSFVDHETGLSSKCDPRWNFQVRSVDRRKYLRFDLALNTGPSAIQRTDECYATLHRLLQKNVDAETAFLVANANGYSSDCAELCSIQQPGAFRLEEEAEWLLDKIAAARRRMEYSSAEESGAEDEEQAMSFLVGHFRVKGNNATATADTGNEAYGGSHAVKLPQGCVVFGYVKQSSSQAQQHSTNIQQTDTRLRILAPFKGVVSGSSIMKFECVPPPRRRTSAEIRELLGKVTANHAQSDRVSTLYAMLPRPHFLSADSDSSEWLLKSTLRECLVHDPNFLCDSRESSPRRVTTRATESTPPKSALQVLSQAWETALFESPLCSPREMNNGVVRSRETWVPFKRSSRAKEHWRSLQRNYKLVALKLAQEKIWEAQKQLDEAFCEYSKVLSSTLEARMCKICWNCAVNTTCVECGHQCVCSTCAEALKNCPMCIQPVSEFCGTTFADLHPLTTHNIAFEISATDGSAHQGEDDHPAQLDVSQFWARVCAQLSLTAEKDAWCSPASLLEEDNTLFVDTFSEAEALASALSTKS